MFYDGDQRYAITSTGHIDSLRHQLVQLSGLEGKHEVNELELHGVYRTLNVRLRTKVV